MSVAVVDASVVVAALVDAGEVGEWAEGRLLDAELASPHLVLVETSSILRRSVLAGDVSAEEASLAHADLLALTIQLFAFEPFGERVWELRDNLTAYDAWYVALAETLDGPLLTLDPRLAGVPGVRCDVDLPPA